MYRFIPPFITNHAFFDKGGGKRLLLLVTCENSYSKMREYSNREENTLRGSYGIF
jgi:hypothetical protein